MLQRQRKNKDLAPTENAQASTQNPPPRLNGACKNVQLLFVFARHAPASSVGQISTSDWPSRGTKGHQFRRLSGLRTQKRRPLLLHSPRAVPNQKTSVLELFMPERTKATSFDQRTREPEVRGPEVRGRGQRTRARGQRSQEKQRTTKDTAICPLPTNTPHPPLSQTKGRQFLADTTKATSFASLPPPRQPPLPPPQTQERQFWSSSGGRPQKPRPLPRLSE